MPKKKEDISFEQLYNELEETIEKLEEGNLSLDDALELYQRGMELAGQCGPGRRAGGGLLPAIATIDRRQ